MAKTNSKPRTPLFRVVKRDQAATTWYFRVLVRAIAIVAALLVSVMNLLRLIMVVGGNNRRRR